MTFKEIEKVLEEKGVKYEIKPEEEFGFVEFWTDTAGQDIVTELKFDGTPEGFIKDFAFYAETYDVDEEVAVYVNMRGQNSVPATVSELLDDCQEAKNKLMDIAAALKGLINPETAKYEKTNPTPSADNNEPVVKTKELTENEVRTVLAVFSELRKISYDKLNTFLGSMTIDEMNQLNNKLNDWYQGEVLGKEYDEEFGWYEPSQE